MKSEALDFFTHSLFRVYEMINFHQISQIVVPGRPWPANGCAGFLIFHLTWCLGCRIAILPKFSNAIVYVT